MRTYYTYAYLREDGTPYYIGKGSGNRAYCPRNRAVRFPSDPSRILILKKSLTEEEAFRHECYMISIFGRKNNNTGILRNFTDGGEGPSGYRHSEETIQKIREAMNRPETRTSIQESNRNRACSPETRLKLSKLHKGRKHSQEFRDKVSRFWKGKTSKKKGTTWWCHPSGNRIQALNPPGPDWKPGMKWRG
jgi:hypothetical protein